MPTIKKKVNRFNLRARKFHFPKYKKKVFLENIRAFFRVSFFRKSVRNFVREKF